MRRGVGNYVRTGLGGTRSAAARFGGTARTAGRLYGVLGGTGQGTDIDARLDRALLEGRSARDVIDAIVEAAQPVDGTQDAEAGRRSISDALSDLMTRFPAADLLNLSEDQRHFVIERFVAMDIWRRFMLDVGNAIRNKAPSPLAAVARLKEVREYIRETVAAAFRRMRREGQRMTAVKIPHLVKAALLDAFDVFSGFAE